MITPRRRRRLQRRLRKAEALRAKGAISQLEYSLIALDVIDRLSGGSVRAEAPGSVRGRAYEHMKFGIEATGALYPQWSWPKYDFEAATKEFGPYRDALGVIQDALRLPPYSADELGPNFTMTPAIANRVRLATRQLNRTYRSLGRLESWLSDHKERYPLVTTTVGNILLAVLSALLGFLVGGMVAS